MTTANAPTSAAPSASPGLAGLYAPALADLDELTEPGGALRPHWGPLVSMLDDLGPTELQLRAEQARRLVREHGITHNIYDDPLGHARPWSLDLLPLLMPAAEWTAVGDALVQRAQLLNMLLADLYGPATALEQGLIPPELVYGNPAFLRPCHNIDVPLGQWLHLYAADVVRTTGGEFRVIADRTQAPSGAGYSLENRIVISRVLASAFAQCNVLRLAPFFISLRRTLAAMAPPTREDPRIVLLTPGPYNETYFEHAYLARYLGYPLVQGNDLTVRDCRVYLKTLGGLQRVDVILRRVDDDFCDPLELYPQSFLGVAGLLQAVRERTVAVANALGSGTVQGTAFLPFLPRLCQHFLKQDLKLASVRTWWCGDAESCGYVLDHLPELVIKRALPGSRRTEPIFGAQLASTELDALAARIRHRPRDFVAQEQVETFMAPVFQDGQVQPRRYVARAYLAAAGDSYAVMPGCLTRVTGWTDSRIVSLQKGGGSKDTWIIGDEAQRHVSLLTQAAAPVVVSRVGGDLPSRVADDLFWLGRYVQRADASARLARCIFNRLEEPMAVDNPRAIAALMFELVGHAAPKTGPAAARALSEVLFSERDPSGLRSAAERFVSLARILRDRISADAWRILQSIHRDVTEFDGAVGDDEASVVVELFNRVVAGLLAFGGILSESMTRGQAWRFLELGLRIERGIASARLVRATMIDVPREDTQREEPYLLEALLDAFDSTLTYRRRYLDQLQAPAVADLLLADESNPRALAFQVKSVEEHLSSLPREPSHPQRNPDLQLAMRLRTTLRLEDLTAACRAESGRRPRLDALTKDVMDTLSGISELVAQTFFTHATVAPRPLAPEQEQAL